MFSMLAKLEWAGKVRRRALVSTRGGPERRDRGRERVDSRASPVHPEPNLRTD